MTDYSTEEDVAYCLSSACSSVGTVDTEQLILESTFCVPQARMKLFVPPRANGWNLEDGHN